MSGYLWAGVGLVAAMVAAAVGDLVSDEIRGWLDLLPRGILRLAAARLNAFQQATTYEDEWLPELCYILRGAEARPISRLLIGIRFSLSLLVASRRAWYLNCTQPFPQVFTATPKDPALLAILERITKNLSESKPPSLRIVPGIHVPRQQILLGELELTPDQLRAFRQEEEIIVLKLGDGQGVPMKLDEFDDIATRLEHLARSEQRKPQELREVTAAGEEELPGTSQSD